MPNTMLLNGVVYLKDIESLRLGIALTLPRSTRRRRAKLYPPSLPSMAISIITLFTIVLDKGKSTNQELMVSIVVDEKGKRGRQIG